jgi:hypothetical protein
MSLIGVQGFAITRIEHTGKAKAAASAAKAGHPYGKLRGTRDEE